MAHKNFYVGINLNGNTLQGLSDGVNLTDAVTKQQLDTAIDSVLEMTEVRYELTTDLEDSVAKIVTHNLGKKFVQVSVYDSTGNKIEVNVVVTDLNTLSVTSTVALTGVTIVVSV